MQTNKRRFLLGALAAAPAAMLAAPTFAKAAAAPTKPVAKPARVTGTAAEQESALALGLADARFAADRIDAFHTALGASAILSSQPWLALSTGGEYGAFGAGLLNGWTETGTRPTFAVVTGVSTGALIAPFAFLGSRWDGALREAYTAITAADVFEIGATETSLVDTWPLTKLIARFVTPELLAAVAEQHAAGRRLFVVTTNLDSGRPIAWNLGAIATKGDPAALRLFRDVLLASGAIPGLFPPVGIEVEANGQMLRELHADGGTITPFYVAPEAMLAGEGGDLPARSVYVIVNNRLDAEFSPTQPSLMGVLGNALTAAVKASTRAALTIHANFARERGIALQVAMIDARFKPAPAGPFSQVTMQALYAHARSRARNAEAFDARQSVRLAQR